ncbi:MAG: efflux transporter outer membrane subunit [Methylobacteriaceae bacterium]|nr:efflux transporter outer membrane subunit [Methylobacteriaceae bacterium]
MGTRMARAGAGEPIAVRARPMACRWHAARGRKLLAIGLGSLLASGCSLEGPLPDLAIPIPTAYRASVPAPAAPPPIDWPNLFRSKELTALVVEAEYQNLDIAVAVARIAQADAQASIDAAGLYPTLTGDANAERTHSAGTARSKKPPFRSTSSNLFSFGLTASYEIDFWGKNYAAAEAGNLLAEASRFDRDVVALSTIATLVTDYLLVLGAQDRLRIAHENIRTAERVLDAIKARLSVGTATALDVAQQESVVATQRATVPPLEQQLLQTKNLIAILLGRTPESLTVVGGSLDRLAIPRVRPGLPSQLLLRRPDIAEAEAQVAAQNESVASARAAMFPNISLTAQGGFESLLLKTLLRPEAATASLAAGITQPILDGYSLEGQFELQKGKLSEFLQTYRKAVISAFSDVENALVAVQQTTEHERLQVLAVTASKRAQDITEARLREGTIDVTTLLQTELTLFQAEDELSQVRLQKLQAYVSLFQALGGGYTPQVDPQPPLDISVKPFIPVPVTALSPTP